MANVKSETFTTADGTVVKITVNGQEFRVEGRRPAPTSPDPVDRWTLRQELAGVKLMVFGFGLGIVGVLILCTGALLAFG